MLRERPPNRQCSEAEWRQDEQLKSGKKKPQTVVALRVGTDNSGRNCSEGLRYRALVSTLQEHYRVFAKQDAAFAFADSLANSRDWRVFAQELNSSGARQFVVWHWPVFAQWYLAKHFRSEACHYYEVIREHEACRLYLDLEYQTAANPDLDGPGLVTTVLDAISAKLLVDHGVQTSTSDFLQLDSCTPAKFSRHVVLQSPLFKDAAHVKRFVLDLVASLSTSSSNSSQTQSTQETAGSCSDDGCSGFAALSIECPTQHFTQYSQAESGSQSSRPQTDGPLWVESDRPGQRVNFVDVSVYSRNRCFRMVHSSKFGKSTVLR